MELTVTLPANLPLGQVTVSGDERRAGVQKSQWRTWILQLTVFLTYQVTLLLILIQVSTITEIISDHLFCIALLTVNDVSIRFRSRFCFADNDDMIVPSTRTVHHGHCEVSVSWQPQIWNTLPSHLNNINISREQFKPGLKTWIFV